MALVHTEAVVLRSYNLAEADRIVVCLTRSAGLVRAVARGARKMKSRFGAALEPFTLIRLTFYQKENRELVVVSQAEIVKSHFDLAAQPEAARALAYIGELVAEFAPPHEGDEKMFRMVTACIEALAESVADAQLVLRYFEVWLLRLAGFFPDPRRCAQCGASFDETRPAYLNVEARPCCHACSHGLGEILTGETQQWLLATHRLGPLDFVRSSQTVSAKSQAQVASMTQRLLLGVLDRRPRTLIHTREEEARPANLVSAAANHNRLS